MTNRFYRHQSDLDPIGMERFMKKKDHGAILCPTCRRLVSADEKRCPHCGTPRPGAFVSNNPVARTLSRPETLIRSIIALNAGMFVISLLFTPGIFRLSMNPLALFSPDSRVLDLLGATGTRAIDQLNFWWSLVAANYLHGGILHIFFNMMAFKQLAPFVIREYGPSRMLLIYTVGGIAGFWISYAAGIYRTIGASAAVCALIGACLYYGKSRGGIYGQTVYRQVGGWAISLFLFGLLVPGINNWGHGGGMVAGVLLGFVLGYQERRLEKPMHRILALVAALITLAILGWSVTMGAYYRFFY
jgi:membrane associated rhomboid family serine protease